VFPLCSATVKCDYFKLSSFPPVKQHLPHFEPYEPYFIHVFSNKKFILSSNYGPRQCFALQLWTVTHGAADGRQASSDLLGAVRRQTLMPMPRVLCDSLSV